MKKLLCFLLLAVLCLTACGCEKSGEKSTETESQETSKPFYVATGLCGISDLNFDMENHQMSMDMTVEGTYRYICSFNENDILEKLEVSFVKDDTGQFTPESEEDASFIWLCDIDLNEQGLPVRATISSEGSYSFSWTMEATYENDQIKRITLDKTHFMDVEKQNEDSVLLRLTEFDEDDGKTRDCGYEVCSLTVGGFTSYSFDEPMNEIPKQVIYSKDGEMFVKYEGMENHERFNESAVVEVTEKQKKMFDQFFILAFLPEVTFY